MRKLNLRESGKVTLPKSHSNRGAEPTNLDSQIDAFCYLARMPSLSFLSFFFFFFIWICFSLLSKVLSALCAHHSGKQELDKERASTAVMQSSPVLSLRSLLRPLYRALSSWSSLSLHRQHLALESPMEPGVWEALKWFWTI